MGTLMTCSLVHAVVPGLSCQTVSLLPLTASASKPPPGPGASAAVPGGTSLAAEGRTVLISSHLMGEVALTATNLIIIGRGRLLADTTVAKFTAESGLEKVTVACSDPAELRAALLGPGVSISGEQSSERLEVTGLSARAIGIAAARASVIVYELTPQAPSLEEAFMALTGEAVEYHGAGRAELAGRAR